MRSAFRQWFAERAELIVLGLTVLTTATLVGWWTILLRDEMRSNEMLERALLATQSTTSADQRERDHEFSSGELRCRFDQRRDGFGRCARQDAVTEIEDAVATAAGALHRFEQGARTPADHVGAA